MHSGWEGTRLTASGLFVCILCLYVCGCGCVCACVRLRMGVRFTSGADLTGHCLPPGGFRDSARMTFFLFLLFISSPHVRSLSRQDALFSASALKETCIPAHDEACRPLEILSRPTHLCTLSRSG